MDRAKFGLRYVVGAALCLAAASPALADGATPSAYQSPVAALWAGAAFKPHVAVGFAGGLWSPTGNLDSQGWLLRGEYLYVGYNFSSTAATNGSASGQLNRADGQVGYQIVNSGIAASVLVGPDYEDFSVTPSAANDRRLSDKLGAMIVGRVARVGKPFIPVSLEGNYSTANDSYWTQAKAGVNLGRVTIGPALGLLGNNAFDEARYGAYSSIDLTRNLSVQVGAGYAQSLRSHSTTSGGGGGNGGYGEITFVCLLY